MSERPSDQDADGRGAAEAVARLEALQDEMAKSEAGSGDGERSDATGEARLLPDTETVEALPVDMAPTPTAVRIAEALLFASQSPLGAAQLAPHLPDGSDVAQVLAAVQANYADRGIRLVQVAGKWAFRTAEDLSYLLEKHAVDERKLSRAALETLSIIAYHQPVTRAEIEGIRGVATSKGTLDVLLESSWVRPRGRRRAPGKPITYGTTEAFLDHFGLDTVKDLPGLVELRGAGLLDDNLPPGFKVPEPSDIAALMPDELPLDMGSEDEEQGMLELEAEQTAEDGPDGEVPQAAGERARRADDEAAT